MIKTEAALEAYLRSVVTSAGGLCLKWVSPGYTGVPDRMILMPGGKVYFVELKSPGKRERPRQQYVQRQLHKLGFSVFPSVDSVETIEQILEVITK